jgi:16S rRNA (uracil1498-N3)-methyltransferase
MGLVNTDRGEFAYAPPEAKSGNVIQLSPEEAHHLFRVRRIRENEIVWVSNGAGLVYECRAEPDHSLCIIKSYPGFAESRVAIHLCCGVLKGEANRDVVAAAVQLGVTEIIFFHAQRSEGRFSESVLAKLQRTAVSALKQCGRATLPAIKTGTDLAGAFAMLPEHSRIFVAQPLETKDLERPEVSANATTPLALAVGPEGGLTQAELEMAQRHGSQLLNLAPARLRSETAVVVGLSFLLGLAGECRASRE